MSYTWAAELQRRLHHADHLPVDPDGDQHPHCDGLPVRGLKSRAPSGTTAILAPRFLASAFCSGPALLVLIFQTLRKVSADPASRTRAAEDRRAAGVRDGREPLLSWAARCSRSSTRHSHHVIHAQVPVVRAASDGDAASPIYSWFALICNVSAFVIFIVPVLRNRMPVLLNVGCALAGERRLHREGPRAAASRPDARTCWARSTTTTRA